ncbi:hypothetical protein JTE90_011225 [Oedothorax gibbosus]|uniref:Rrn7/TAF1B C-terminal cyclin domain-containing protein n=1 Tax=Oedothorax gibbosus TaxID=931172 RepID=A0AAV6VYJ7_9ARAC|nr:hypothetical protein JTE90_011225 [Oedothorax gibbosus]
MQCRVCNSLEFVLFDGVYFCKECNSQIEASRKEESQQDGGYSRKSLLKTKAKEKTKEQKEQKLYDDWTTIEGYNIILHKQVSTLISLGASEKLKNVVLYIWSKYLEKCEIAFRNDCTSVENIPRLGACARVRDKEVLYGNKNAALKRRRKKKQSKPKNILVKKEDATTSDEFMTDDNETSDCQTTEIESESDVDSENSSTSTKYKLKFSSVALQSKNKIGAIKLKKDPKYTKSLIHNMTLCKTLSFCYLGLLYTEDRLLLCDLLRLAKERKIPYIEVTDVFPPSMKMVGNDHTYYTTYSVPAVADICLTVAKLFEFLKLPSFKHPPLIPAVFRFVKELNLPDSLIHIANHLYNRMERKTAVWYKTQSVRESQVFRIPKYDVQAMALIVVSLKLLLLLDGNFEVEHSKIMMKINILLEGQKMFVWDEWQKQMKLKEFLFLKNGCKYSDFSRLDALSVDEIIRKYPISKIREYGDYTNRVKPNDFKFSEGRKELKALIESVTHLGDTVTNNKPTSFPLKQELTRFTEEGDTWEMFKETTQRDFTLLNKDFSSHLMFYRRTDEISEKSEELIYILLSTLYESSEVLTLSHFASSCESMLKTTSKYWYKNIQQDAFVERRQLWREKLPSSFVWLLEVLCKYLQVTCQDLYLEVLAIEKELFLHKNLPKD